MITAQEALKLSKKDEAITKEYLDILEKKIKEAAQKGYTCIHIGEHPYSMWLYSDKNQDKPVKDTLKALEENGYKVSFHYKEMSMGVDYALVIDWSIKEDE